MEQLLFLHHIMTLGMMKKKNNQDDVVGAFQTQEVSLTVADGFRLRQGLDGYDGGLSPWDMFVKVVAAHVDPVLASMLYATQFVKFDQAHNIVHVATLKKFVLFQDLFIEQKKNYQEYLDRIFGFKTVLVVDFIHVSEPKKIVVQKHEVQKGETLLAHNQKSVVQKAVDVSDHKKWKVTHALLEHFGGTVKEIVKEKHEFDA